jgi:hypothetical protein
MSSIMSLERALKWISNHPHYYDFMLERQPSGDFAVLFKSIQENDWEYLP